MTTPRWIRGVIGVTTDRNETTVVRLIMPRMKVLTRSGVDVADSISASLVKSLRVMEPVRKRTKRA
jgi:hypothetical protein